LSPAALAIQLLNGLASASSLFLVAAGLTLIFGVSRIVNFAHGSLYMLGAYGAYAIGRFVEDALGRSLGGFVLTVLVAAAAVGLLGALLERIVLRRLYGAPELLQLTATFALVLVIRDATLAAFGAEDLLGPRVPGLAGVVEILGRPVPQYDLAMIAIGPVVLAALAFLIARTRFGVLVRATAEDRSLAGALGIDERQLATAVFALGALLGGLAGALQLPREPANLGMDLSVIADAFVVTVVGGLGSIPGAFLAALLIGITKTLCIALGDVHVLGVTLALPRATLVVEFIVMAAVLAVRPNGLLGRPPPPAAATVLPEQRALVRRPGRAHAVIALAILVAAVALGLRGDDYTRVLATDVLIATLFTASLQFLTGMAGIVSFGHAAYFGVGAYAAALAIRHDWPFVAALALAPLAAGVAAWSFGALSVRLAGIYRAMLTLAFAQIVWSIAFQWDAVTGGSNGLVGLWPPAWLTGGAYYFLALSLVATAWLALFALARTPFGFAARAGRDAPMRAEALGIDVRDHQWRTFAIAGAFAGLAGGLYAFSKGSLSPETLGIARSVDVLVMLLLGGLNAVFGPLLGAGAFVWLQDVLARTTPYWRACVGIGIVVLVIAFPQGLGGGYARWRSRRRSA
jgi:branched-chain amino acid transport system permease protein